MAPNAFIFHFDRVKPFKKAFKTFWPLLCKLLHKKVDPSFANLLHKMEKMGMSLAPKAPLAKWEAHESL